MVDLGHLLALVLPLAVGAAISPIVFSITGVLLGAASHPLRRALAFAAGFAAVLVGVGLLGLFVINLAPGDDLLKKAVIRIVLGGLLLAYAVVSLVRGPREREPATGPDESAGRRLLPFIGLGMFSMATNFTSLAIYVPLIEEISRSGQNSADKAAALLVSDLVIMLPIWIPICAYLIAPSAAQRLLSAVNSFLHRRSHAITVALTGGFGLYLLVSGLVAAWS